jgi:hypothetical protein
MDASVGDAVGAGVVGAAVVGDVEGSAVGASVSKPGSQQKSVTLLSVGQQ